MSAPAPGLAPAVPAPGAARAWLAAARPATLSVGAVPVAVGSAVAAASGEARWLPGLLALGVALSLQVGTNLFNDYADFRAGADGPDRVGPPRATQQRWLRPRQVLGAAVAAFALALALGGGLVALHGWPLLALGTVCVACGFAYTGGPLPLAYVGLGDLFVLVFFGGVATVGTTYAHTGALSPAAAWAALPVGALATAVLGVNNLRDRISDARAGKRTLAARWGARFARGEYAALVGVAYAAPPVAWAAGGLPAGALLPLVTLPLAAARVRAVYRADGAALNPELGRTAALQVAYGALLAGGLLL